MNSQWIVRRLTLLITASLSVGAPLGAMPGLAQTLLEEQGTILPAEHIYTFEGEADQTVTVTLTSDTFDPVLILMDAEGNEIANNDDFGGSFNATLIVELPIDGFYTVKATSFDGQGGDYELVVRLATPYESLYSEGQELNQIERFDEAISAYTEAIQLSPEEIPAYLGRAEAYLGRAYVEQEGAIQSPEDLPETTKTAIIADFEKAADLIEANGNLQWARSLREQASLLRNNPVDDETIP